MCAYEPVIGLEVHVQLNTKSKIFCSCPNNCFTNPNEAIDVICCGYPGTLPVFNREVVTFALMVGLSTNCAITSPCRFDRKHYFYADLPKGYQITQQEFPICTEGYLEGKTGKKVRIHHIHIEEDAGKNIHADPMSFVDLNRAGTPLIEIVTYPDMATSEEAKYFLKQLHRIVTALGVTTGDMETGAFRADANVSVRKKGETTLRTKCEIKNVNSFKFIGDALDYEIQRQIACYERGEQVRQQTRLWDTRTKETVIMREKESADDYRYLEEPDIPPLTISPEWIAQVKASLPLLPHEKIALWEKKYALSAYDAEIIIDDDALAAYFEQSYALHPSKTVVSLLMREILAIVKEKKYSFSTLPLTPAHLATLAKLIDNGKVTMKNVPEIIDSCAQSGECPFFYVQRNNLIARSISEAELREMVEKCLKDHPQLVDEYRKGKEKLKGVFIGKILGMTKGAGSPQLIERIVGELLSRE